MKCQAFLIFFACFAIRRVHLLVVKSILTFLGIGSHFICSFSAWILIQEHEWHSINFLFIILSHILFLLLSSSNMQTECLLNEKKLKQCKYIYRSQRSIETIFVDETMLSIGMGCLYCWLRFMLICMAYKLKFHCCDKQTHLCRTLQTILNRYLDWEQAVSNCCSQFIHFIVRLNKSIFLEAFQRIQKSICISIDAVWFKWRRRVWVWVCERGGRRMKNNSSK